MERAEQRSERKHDQVMMCMDMPSLVRDDGCDLVKIECSKRSTTQHDSRTKAGQAVSNGSRVIEDDRSGEKVASIADEIEHSAVMTAGPECSHESDEEAAAQASRNVGGQS